jgi:hypothetical protein
MTREPGHYYFNDEMTAGFFLQSDFVGIVQ